MWKSIKKYLVLIILFLFTVTLAVIRLVNHAKLNGEYVYVIGEITKKEPYRSGGVIYTYIYSFRKAIYMGRNTDVFWHKNVGDIFFIKVLLKDKLVVGEIKFVEDIPVPYCLTMDSVPREGWKELPVNICK